MQVCAGRSQISAFFVGLLQILLLYLDQISSCDLWTLLCPVQLSPRASHFSCGAMNFQLSWHLMRLRSK
jgi:hypothetical protein